MSGPIVIWGAGAIGGTIGAALVRAGEDVLFVDAAADHVKAMNAGGLEITGPVDPFHVQARAVTPGEVDGRFGRVFLCVKAHHTAGAVEALKPYLADDGYVVSAQNGLNERVIAERIGRERTVGCFVNFGADYMEPGIVQYSGRGAVVVGELDGARTPRIEAIHALLKRFDEKAVLTDNIWGYLWSKMVYGAQLFATAVTNEGIADLLAHQRYRAVFVRLADEVVAVAQAEGVRLESFNGFDPAAFLPGAPAQDTARSFDDMVAHNRRSVKSHTGIWRDLAIRKRPTEVDAQLGPVVTIGRQHGIETPITARTIALIHEIESGRRPLDLANLDELARLARSAGARAGDAA
jgi:2-dehydropantoate 2-reductase